MGPTGSANFKTLLLQRIAVKRFLSFPEISSQVHDCHHQITLGRVGYLQYTYMG